MSRDLDRARMAYAAACERWNRAVTDSKTDLREIIRAAHALAATSLRVTRMETAK